jgi:GR25 family glycosyltransferase involved in LPS biosynthesis
MLGSVVAVVFQIIYCVEMHVNDVFLFFKNYFWYQHIKTIQNIQTILNFNKKKFKIFWEHDTKPR